MPQVRIVPAALPALYHRSHSRSAGGTLRRRPAPGLQRLLPALALALSLAAPSAAWSQTYPSRTIRIICPFSPGGSIDKLARLVGRKMEESLGVPVVVENRTGGGGSIGTKAMVDARPDGYTLGILSPGPTAVMAGLGAQIPYHIEKDISYIVALASVVGVMVAGPDFPARSPRELIELAKKNPGKITYGTSGVGSSTHLQVELFSHAAGVKMTHVPFKGAGNGVGDVLGGHVNMLMTTLATAGSMINAGKLQGVYVFESQRFPTHPQLPAVTEGLPGFTPPPNWYGLAGPGGLPPAIVDRLNREAVAAMASPDLQKEIIASAYRIIGGTPQDYLELIRKDVRMITEVGRTAGIRLE